MGSGDWGLGNDSHSASSSNSSFPIPHSPLPTPPLGRAILQQLSARLRKNFRFPPATLWPRMQIINPSQKENEPCYRKARRLRIPKASSAFF